ncbi:FAD-binding protein [Spirosoma pollinicola]|uniref:FAD-binding protein n=1 Tax=Spirosoma pollinicola TaxID=2057025 RepID=A0A2K8Z790_9BACT|nr:FAD-binding protein [Spirosoma pollinicola]AUD05756.1 FAD-binding protein [Spirosoma pollinicola]
MRIHPTNQRKWKPRHETFEQGIENLYDLVNDETDSIVDDYNSTTVGIQKIIAEAVQKKRHLRAIGGEWSFTKISATDGILLNTKLLNLTIKITPSSVQASYPKTADDLFFCQCGVSVQEISDRLRKRKRSLMTSGASNGQTIAGALSTGTHGSAFDVGSISNFVVGLHIIVSPTRHVWLEKKSYPVASTSFVRKINAELVQDDELFNAALVSFGSFGFIHGVMIETVPLFLYECYRERMLIDDALLTLMTTLDFTDSALPCGNERPYHFQALLNLYDMDNGAYMTSMYKRPYTDKYTPPEITLGAIGPGDDAPSFIGKLTEGLPSLVPAIVNALTNSTYKPFSKVMGTHGEIFSNTDIHGKVLSTAIGVDVSNVLRVKDIILDLNETNGPFTGVVAFRYVKGTDAVLGFTRFPTTCVIELDGIFSNRTITFCEALWDTLETESIPFTFHWGKILKLTKDRLRMMYSDTNVDRWIAARNKLMQDADCMRVFTNDMMTELGLNTVLT